MKELTRQDFKDWGRKGGLASRLTQTKAKAAASRRNGKLGGRPKGSKNREKNTIDSRTVRTS